MRFSVFESFTQVEDFSTLRTRRARRKLEARAATHRRFDMSHDRSRDFSTEDIPAEWMLPSDLYGWGAVLKNALPYFAVLGSHRCSLSEKLSRRGSCRRSSVSWDIASRS